MGPDNPEVAATLSSLAFALKALREYREAETSARQALGILEKALGPNHPDVARQAINLAYLLDARGDYEAARTLFRRALPVAEKELGSDHELIRAIRKNLSEKPRPVPRR